MDEFPATPVAIAFHGAEDAIVEHRVIVEVIFMVVVEVDVEPVPRRLVDQVVVGTDAGVEHVGVVHYPAVGVIQVFSGFDGSVVVEIDGVV